MKKLSLIIIATLGSITLSFAQTNVLNSTGSAGVGTISPESGFIFDVNGLGTIGTQASARLYLGTLDATHAFIQSRNYSINQNLTFLAKSFNFDIGNVGVGTASPVEKFSVAGNLGIQLGADGSGLKLKGSYQGNYSIVELKQEANDGFVYVRNGLGVNVSRISGYTQSPTFFLSNVGIGITNPSEKLAVNGAIRAKEVKVEAANWPDYVFAKDYKLPSLKETEKHIKEKGHLPGIPSAAEVKVHGIELGEMNVKLLQKIEELTLHLIIKEKEIKNLKDTVNEQGNKINQIISELKKSK